MKLTSPGTTNQNFVGAFSSELKEAAESLGMEIGTIMQSPMEGLVKFHGEEA